ncbi:MAG TPA: hypothetical protein VFU21_09940 [Kofleriaceae bacterium]|nr:hypothetical protein [Kofleriaceae bacterium]
MIRSLVGVGAILGALAGAAGCEGKPAGRCDTIYSKVEQMPEFKQAGFAKYGNELRAAFGEGCSKLPETELTCMETAKTAQDLEKCPGGRDAFKAALEKIVDG